MLAGGDNYLKAINDTVSARGETINIIFQEDLEPLKIVSNFLYEHPSILIIDDDYLFPNTLSVLDIICRFNKKTRIIFSTSSTSIKLGKQVN